MTSTLSIGELFTKLEDFELLEEERLEVIRTRLRRIPHRLTADKYLDKFISDGVISRELAIVLQSDAKEWQLFGKKYLLLDKIGEGGMGVVYRAYHRSMDRIVALKLLSDELLKSNRQAMQRFQREVKAAAQLVHPHIATAYDADEHDGRPFLVMEYVEGISLSMLVKRQGVLSFRRAADYIKQAALGLGYAHRQGLVHRDVKPGNLQLSTDGSIKVLDLGLVRFLQGGDEGETLTGTGEILGTSAYMSPEQAAHTKHADHRADIYSLGCTFYFLLRARPPFRGNTFTETIIAHRVQPILPSLNEIPGITDEVKKILQKMLAKKVNERYQRMEEVVEAIDACDLPEAEPPIFSQDSSMSERPTVVGNVQHGSNNSGKHFRSPSSKKRFEQAKTVLLDSSSANELADAEIRSSRNQPADWKKNLWRVALLFLITAGGSLLVALFLLPRLLK
ncbi:Serine/threonine protein kinase [Planctomycetales bacterium 10988]|nr:Serine/threonine protein kinase [Planctomycetales bacterium 10988]